jgi:Protein kinase domain
MGQIQRIPEIISDTEKRIRSRLSHNGLYTAWQLIVTINGKDKEINLNRDLITTEVIIYEVSKVYKGDKKIVALKTKENIDILDYMLCVHKMPINYLKDREHLIPIFSEPVLAYECASNYVPIKIIGKGDYSTVSLVRRKDTGFLCVIKTVSKDYSLENPRFENLLSEKNVLFKLNHPFIIQIQSIFQTVIDI